MIYDDLQDNTVITSDGISVSAISGLCFVLDFVLELSDKAENKCRVHIVLATSNSRAGHIRWSETGFFLHHYRY